MFDMHSAVGSTLLGAQIAGSLSVDRPSGHHYLPSPARPRITTSSDYLDLPQVTLRGSTYIALLTDYCARHTDVFAATPAEFMDEGTANLSVCGSYLNTRCIHTSFLVFAKW